MDIYSTRQQLRTRTIYDIPMRVTFYARVSTDSDEQLNSLENQTQYYHDYIRKNPNWIPVSGYIDEGLSAATTKKRENFNQMIADARLGKFDFIITKELTRFARNTLDSIKFTRELLSYGVCVLFQVPCQPQTPVPRRFLKTFFPTRKHLQESCHGFSAYEPCSTM